MISSMTGYGMGETPDFRVELRSVNHRHLDIQVRLPTALYPHETRIKERIRKRVSRGRIDVFIHHTGSARSRLGINGEAARSVVKGLRDLQAELQLPGAVDVGTVAGIRELYEQASGEEVEFDTVIEPLDAALDQLIEMRDVEGRVLKEDVAARLSTIEEVFESIRPLAEGHRDRIETQLRERISQYREDLAVEEPRLLQEVFFLVDKADITEELVRAGSHIAQGRGFLERGGTVGRKLDFLSQEILREANTVASKAGQSEIAHHVVEIKDQIEKIREQVQNIQ